jgi:hypothetical protein
VSPLQVAHFLGSATAKWGRPFCVLLPAAAQRGPVTRSRGDSDAQLLRSGDSERALKLLERQSADLMLAIMRSHDVLQPAKAREAAANGTLDALLERVPAVAHVEALRIAVQSNGGSCVIDAHGTHSAQAAAALLRHVPELQRIGFAAAHLAPAANVARVAASAARARGLRSLRYEYGTPAGALALAKKLPRMKRLRSLAIANSRLEGKHYDVILPQTAAALPRLTHLNISSDRSIHPDLVWRPDANGSVPGVHLLVRCLRRMTQLRRLEMRNLCTDDATAAAMAPALQALPNLSHLDISQTPQRPAVRALQEYNADMELMPPSASIVDAFSRCAAAMARLTYLSMSRVGFPNARNDAPALRLSRQVAMAQALAQLSQLRHLRLAAFGLRDGAAAALVQAVAGCCKLSKLDLSRNPVSNDGAVACAPHVAQLASLRWLIVRVSKMRHRGAAALRGAVVPGCHVRRSRKKEYAVCARFGCARGRRRRSCACFCAGGRGNTLWPEVLRFVASPLVALAALRSLAAMPCFTHL